jgi:hypothetical protein
MIGPVVENVPQIEDINAAAFLRLEHVVDLKLHPTLQGRR